jgi:hypothetical protein
MKEKEPANRSMPPQPALKDGGTGVPQRLVHDAVAGIDRAAGQYPRRCPRWAVGAV